MKGFAVVSIEDGMLLGLRFRRDVKLCVTDIVGLEALEDAATVTVPGFSAHDQLVRLPSREPLNEAEVEQEGRIHMLSARQWYSEQTADILLHQIRPNLRCNTVSPLAALAALQRELRVGISYLSKQRDIYLNDGSIKFGTEVAHSGSQPGYLCGAEASRKIGSLASARLLRFEDLPIELSMAVRAELSGLGHLFALTVGAALHVVNTADLHTH